MGRPASPNLPSPGYTPRTWATDATYPAGSDPWSGQPTKVEPASPAEGFVPATGASAEEVNKLFNDLLGTQTDTKTYEQGLRDGANAYLQSVLSYLGQLPALRFGASTTGPNTAPSRLAMNPATREWCAGATLNVLAGTSTSFFSRTTDYRAAWNTTNEIPVGSRILAWNSNFRIDNLGNIVIPGGSTDGQNVVEYNGTTWTKHASVFSVSFNTSDVTWDAVSGLWCVAGHTNPGHLVVFTSPDRVTWTQRTSPGSDSRPDPMLASNELGTIVMQTFDLVPDATGFGMGFSRSTDGGVTWSAEQVIATPFISGTTNPFPCRPVWTGSKFVAFASNATDLKTYVMNSADGAAWSIVATLTTAAIQWIDAIGELLVGLTSTGRIVFSFDNGATWNCTDECVSTWKAVFAGAGRLIAMTSGGAVYVGPGTGMGVTPLT